MKIFGIKGLEIQRLGKCTKYYRSSKNIDLTRTVFILNNLITLELRMYESYFVLPLGSRLV
jgi:hypothetical protein